MTVNREPNQMSAEQLRHNVLKVLIVSPQEEVLHSLEQEIAMMDGYYSHAGRAYCYLEAFASITYKKPDLVIMDSSLEKHLDLIKRVNKAGFQGNIIVVDPKTKNPEDNEECTLASLLYANLLIHPSES